MLLPERARWPEALQALLSDAHLTGNDTGCSGDAVFRVEGGPQGPAFLKLAPAQRGRTLEPEVRALRWLQGRLPVPEVRFAGTQDGLDYLLMSALPGHDASSPAFLADPDQAVALYARGLKAMHGLDIRDCPLRAGLDEMLEEARYRCEAGMVDTSDFEDEWLGRPAEALYAALVERRPAREEWVFTHGDYCLPNLIVDGDRLSGYIDLGRAGIADRYHDIALALRSLRHNYGDDRYAAAFLDHYGLETLDQERVDYYVLLDELF